MKKIAVIGLGSFGESLAKSLTEKGAEVIAIDRNMERVEAIQDFVTVAVRMDSTDENALLAQSINEVDTVVVCIGEDFQSNLMTAVLVKQIGVKSIIARATKEIEAKILKAVGIERVINPELEIGEKLAYSLMHPKLQDILYASGDITVAELEAPEKLIGKTLAELDLRRKYAVNIVIIRHKEIKVDKKGNESVTHKTMIPVPETVISRDDVLVLVGHRGDVQKIASLED